MENIFNIHIRNSVTDCGSISYAFLYSHHTILMTFISQNQ